MLHTNTKRAIERRINAGYDRFFVGSYYYEWAHNSILRRREQDAGRTPVNDWELVGWVTKDGVRYV